MAASSSSRLWSLDVMRGLVMVLMTIDHASEAFNAGRLMTDGTFMWKPGTPLPAAQFLLRFITHLCAPTFVFLAGASIAFSSERRRARGESDAAIDRALFARGAFIALLDPLWMALAFSGYRIIILQVLYGIGTSMMAMALLRHLSPRVLCAGALAYLLAAEVAVWSAGPGSAGPPPLWLALIATGGFYPLPFERPAQLIVGYPMLSWLCVMIFGYASAGMLRRRETARLLVLSAIGLALFALIRGANGFGNMGLLRDDGTLVQWLHVSKYPPSLAYLTLELSIMGLLLAGLFALQPTRAAAYLAPLALLGQTALFYYVLHIHLLTLVAHVLGLEHKAGIAAALIATACAVVALYRVCAPYLRYKTAHPDGLARYL